MSCLLHIDTATDVCSVALTNDGEVVCERVADEHPVYIFGGGAAKCADVIAHPNVHFIDGIRPLARHMMPLAERRIAQGRIEDTAYFEPYYLKDFVAIKSTPLF